MLVTLMCVRCGRTFGVGEDEVPLYQSCLSCSGKLQRMVLR